MLTLDTQIPTLARGQVRAIVKAHPEWRIFLEAKELLSANAKNRDLIEFALFHPVLKFRIEQLLGMDTELEQLLKRLAATQHKPKTKTPARRSKPVLTLVQSNTTLG